MVFESDLCRAVVGSYLCLERLVTTARVTDDVFTLGEMWIEAFEQSEYFCGSIGPGDAFRT